MFGKKKDKEKKVREPFNPRKEAKLLPGYIIVAIWVFFTIFLLLWILMASLSTAPEIMQGKVFKFETGFHFENYVNAWNANSISTFFLNSLLYAVVTMVGAVIISAPAAYVLSRFTFLGNKPIRSGFLIAMSIPQIMIVPAADVHRDPARHQWFQRTSDVPVHRNADPLHDHLPDDVLPEPVKDLRGGGRHRRLLTDDDILADHVPAGTAGHHHGRDLHLHEHLE